MRLFYIVLFLSLSINFAGIASQKKRGELQSKYTKTSSVTDKKVIRQHSNLNQDNESLQKDSIGISPLKISFGALVPITFLLFPLLKNKIVNTKVIIKRLRYNYWCLFKMLYPKHVFW